MLGRLTQCRLSMWKLRPIVATTSLFTETPSGSSCGHQSGGHGRWQRGYHNGSSHRNPSTFRHWSRLAAIVATATGATLLTIHKHKTVLHSMMFPTHHAATELSKKRLRQQHNFIADVVEVSAPSVVYIEIKDLRRTDYLTRQPMTASNGSGFIVESDGLILTNAHVVINKPHTAVSVRLQDGRTFIGRVEDIDPASDLATVRVECRNLPTMKLGKSSDVRAGEWVVALGSPLALSNTVTAGVISSTQRPSEELGLKGMSLNVSGVRAIIMDCFSQGHQVHPNGRGDYVRQLGRTAGQSGRRGDWHQQHEGDGRHQLCHTDRPRQGFPAKRYADGQDSRNFEF